MNKSKPILTLASNPTDAKQLAKFFQALTGKQVSPAEIAAGQKKLDEARRRLTDAGNTSS